MTETQKNINEIIKPDAGKKMIRMTEDPRLCFDENPLAMLAAVRLAAELGFDIQVDIYDAILEKKERLKDIGMDGIREEFEKLIVAEHAGKGLKMLAGAQLMPYIIGGVAGKMTKRAINQFAGLIENIDKTKRIRERRLGLFYICFDGRLGREALDFMGFDTKTTEMIKDALRLIEPICFLANKVELKKFIARHGMERYKYLDNLSKAQRIVYDLHDNKILSRHYLLADIQQREEPIVLSDLKIDRNDLTEKNIVEDDKADAILSMLLDLVHKTPALNTRKDLLVYAEKYSKNKIQEVFYKVRLLGKSWNKNR